MIERRRLRDALLIRRHRVRRFKNPPLPADIFTRFRQCWESGRRKRRQGVPGRLPTCLRSEGAPHNNEDRRGGRTERATVRKFRSVLFGRHVPPPRLTDRRRPSRTPPGVPLPAITLDPHEFPVNPGGPICRSSKCGGRSPHTPQRRAEGAVRVFTTAVGPARLGHATPRFNGLGCCRSRRPRTVGSPFRRPRPSGPAATESAEGRKSLFAGLVAKW